MFPESEFKTLDEIEDGNDGAVINMKKLYKIKYTLNLLPSLGLHFTRMKNIVTGEEKSVLKNEGLELL